MSDPLVRNRRPGETYVVRPFVYIATISEFPGLVKIGSSMYPKTRMFSLKSEYRLKFNLKMVFDTDYGGFIELRTHEILSEDLYSGIRSTAREIFKCSVDDAEAAVLLAFDEEGFKYKYATIDE